MPASPRPDALLRDITRLYETAQRHTAACCAGTTYTQCITLTTLGRIQPVSLLGLAHALGYEKSWMSRVIDRLVAEGLVAKRPDANDRRGVVVSLTDAGEQRLSALNDTLNDHAERLMQRIPPDDRDTVIRALSLLRDALYADAHDLVTP